MFESNFPVEKGSCSYGILWNAFKRIASACSLDEKTDLFSQTAACAYRLDGLSSPTRDGAPQLSIK
jgi:predicted TIM-barrel fold metal-dependent hydrolase